MEEIDTLVSGLLGQPDTQTAPGATDQAETSAPENTNTPVEDVVEAAPQGQAEPTADDTADPATDEPQEDEDPEYDIPIGDKSEKVRWSELKNGYLRQQDYTRKTQEVAEQRKTLEAELTANRAKRDQYDAVLADIAKRLGSEDGERSEAEWNNLRASNPAQYAQDYTDYLRRQNQRQAVRQEQQRVAQERNTEQQKALATYVEGERQKLVAAIPEFGDPAKAPALLNSIRQFAKDTFGFSDAELNMAYDSRIIRGMYMAMNAQKAQASIPAAKAKLAAAPTLKPGPKQVNTKSAKQANREAAQRRFDQSGDINDAVALILG